MPCPLGLRNWTVPAILCLLSSSAFSASKPHIITFGKWTTVSWSAESGGADSKPLTLSVRALLVDARIKEFTSGLPHEVTDRLFVVRRAFRINDSLPQESPSPHWQWQRGGWLLVDRITARISPVNLPDFDPLYSSTSWYRDYAAYCGMSDDGKKIYAVVAQISRRKPVLKKAMERITVSQGASPDGSPNSPCQSPTWQRSPTRVAFEAEGSGMQIFAIRGHVGDLVSEDEDEEAAK
jgi:hypothetical protein